MASMAMTDPPPRITPNTVNKLAQFMQQEILDADFERCPLHWQELA